MNIATKAALGALCGIKLASGYSLKGSGLGIGYIGKGIKWTGEKIENGGFAMAKFGGEMVDNGMLAWKIASGALTEEQLQAIVNEGEQKKEAINAEVVEDTGLANLKEAAVKAAETAMEAVAQAVKTVEEKTVTVETAPAKADNKEAEMSPAEMAEAYC